jgi:hypothetical protein
MLQNIPAVAILTGQSVLDIKNLIGHGSLSEHGKYLR